MTKQQAYEHLKNGIIEGSIAQGQWLVERELCRQYGLSRTPIRELLFRLVSERLVVREPSKGFSVRKLTMEHVVEIFQAREALEDMAVMLACQRMDEDTIKRLETLRLQLYEVDVEQEIARAVKLGRLMHNTIRDAAKNSLLSDMYVTIDNLTYLTANLTVRSMKIERRSRASHLEIIDALLGQNMEGARQRMREHLRETSSLLVTEFFAGYMMFSS